MVQTGQTNQRSPGLREALQGQAFRSVYFFSKAGDWAAIGAALRAPQAVTARTAGLRSPCCCRVSLVVYNAASRDICPDISNSLYEAKVELPRSLLLEYGRYPVVGANSPYLYPAPSLPQVLEENIPCKTSS